MGTTRATKGARRDDVYKCSAERSHQGMREEKGCWNIFRRRQPTCKYGGISGKKMKLK